jgi:hypothetical protein
MKQDHRAGWSLDVLESAPLTVLIDCLEHRNPFTDLRSGGQIGRDADAPGLLRQRRHRQAKQHGQTHAFQIFMDTMFHNSSFESNQCLYLQSRQTAALATGLFLPAGDCNRCMVIL